MIWRTWTIPVAAIWCASTVLAVGCGESEQAKREQRKAARAAEQLKRDKLMTDAGAPYNADRSWSKEPFLWTVDVQERMQRAEGRPIVGIARLSDVERSRDSHIVHLLYGDIGEPVVHFVLTCPRPALVGTSRLIGEGWDSFLLPEYVFVAKIGRVRRSGETTVEDAEFKALNSGRRWIAEGECLALRPVPQAETKERRERR